MKKRLLSMLLALSLVIGMLPMTALAAVEKPGNTTTNLIIGVLNDRSFSGETSFPNEPSAGSYGYYYIVENGDSYKAGTSYNSGWISDNVSAYINVDAFWNDDRMATSSNMRGDTYGIYHPEGFDLTKGFFVPNAINETKIIEAWMDANNINESADKYRLIVYVVKYIEDNYGTDGYHVDCKVIPAKYVTLIYDANLPGDDVTVTLPDQKSVDPDSEKRFVKVEGVSEDIIEVNGKKYQFIGWKIDNEGDLIKVGTTIEVTADTTLYAQWDPQHTHDYKPTVTRPTCTEGGYTTYECECGEFYVGNKVGALGHDMQKTADEVAPKCEVPGKTAVYTCANGCGKTEGGEEIPALEHDMQKTADEVAPKCEVPGKTAVYTCANGCGKTEGGDPIEALEHSFTKYVSNNDAACEEDGTKTAECDNGCGEKDTVTDEGSALGHDWDVWTVIKAPKSGETGTAERVCKRVAAHKEQKDLPKLPVDENGNFTGGEGYAFEVIYEPTCTENGLGKYTYTEKENDTVIFEISFEVVIPATGHDYVITVVEADCLNDGYTKYDCSKCDEGDFIAEHVHTDECYACGGTSTVAHEHGPKCYVKALNPNVLRDGWFTCPGEKICLYCMFGMPAFTGAEMIDAYFPMLNIIPDWMSGTLKYHPVRPVAFFCEGEGEHEHTDACELNCEWLAKGHIEVVVPAVEPTCTETGLTEGLNCSRENCPKGGILKPQEKVDKLGHEKGEYKVASETPATCTEWGSIIRRALCTRCEIQLDETVELLKPTGHDYEAVVTDPTCTEGGYTTYTCKNDATHTYIADEVPALGHKPGDPIEVATKDPTCTEPGYVDYNIQCVVCEEVLRNGRRDIPATGHDYEAVVTDPTCTEGGYTTYTCKNDATHTYIANETAALGHDWGDWVVTKQPTYSAKGEERRDCNRCDYYETREIDKKRAPITPVGPAKPEVTTKYLNTKDHVAYIIGYTDGTVRPRGEITRAEIATIYFRLMTDENRENFWSTENEFVDVNENNWFNLAVSTLNNAGVIVDVEDGKFRPNDPITRAELAVMAAQFCEVEGKLPKSAFTDVDEDYWAYEEIKLIEFAGWIEGYPDGTFRPDNTITRAEAMTIINRMLERGVEEDDMLEGMITFVDCAEAEWFYEAVQEATNSHDYKRSKNEVEDRGYKYEIWTELLEAPNWAAMEQAWINAR